MNLDNQSRATFVAGPELQQNHITRSIGGPGSDKRFCILQVALVGSGTAPPLPITVFFRGSGAVINKEKHLYDDRVVVMF